MGTFLGFKMSRKAEGEKKNKCKKKAFNKKKLGNMKDPTNLWGFFLAIFTINLGKMNFLDKMYPPGAVSHIYIYVVEGVAIYIYIYIEGGGEQKGKAGRGNRVPYARTACLSTRQGNKNQTDNNSRSDTGGARRHDVEGQGQEQKRNILCNN